MQPPAQHKIGLTSPGVGTLGVFTLGRELMWYKCSLRTSQDSKAERVVFAAVCNHALLLLTE